MKSLKTIVGVIGIIVKYGAIVTAILKGIQVVSDELQKLNLDNEVSASVSVSDKIIEHE